LVVASGYLAAFDRGTPLLGTSDIQVMEVAVRRQLCGNFLASRGVDIGEENSGTFSGKEAKCRLVHSAGCSRHQRDLRAKRLGT
jgi:hypothetical protein